MVTAVDHEHLQAGDRAPMAVATDLNTGVARLILATGLGVFIAAQLPACRPVPVESSATPAAQSYSAPR